LCSVVFGAIVDQSTFLHLQRSFAFFTFSNAVYFPAATFEATFETAPPALDNPD